MAKPISKNHTRPASKHSRAARRATSPSIDTDKSLKDVEPPAGAESLHRVRDGAGVSKRKSKSKPMSRAQRARQEKTLARAEVVLNRLEKKKEMSLKHGKTIKSRSVAWEDVNEKVEAKSRGSRTTGPHEDSTTQEDPQNVMMGEMHFEDADVVRGPMPTLQSKHAGDGMEQEVSDHTPEVW